MLLGAIQSNVLTHIDIYDRDICEAVYCMEVNKVFFFFKMSHMFIYYDKMKNSLSH